MENVFELNNEKWKGIKCGMFNNSSYWGYKTSVLKSGICKYYRRKMFNKFEWCIVEMYLMGMINKGVRTNLINRLKILLMEEIICLEIGDIYEGIMILNKFSVNENNYVEEIKNLMKYVNIIKDLKRGRVVSYMKNYWCLKYKDMDFDLDSVVCKRVNRYKKEGDDIELLKYGELFINYVLERDERMFGIFVKMYNYKGGSGKRYRRKDGIYLLFSIIEERFCVIKKFRVVFDFVLGMFNRKSMVERMAFGVWLVMMVWKFDELNFRNKEFDSEYINDEYVKSYMKDWSKISIDEDFVVKDYHVNKGYGLGKFANVGAFVVDEDLGILGSNGENYKKLYIDVKDGKEIVLEDYEFKEELEVVDVIVNEKELEFIDWSKFENVKVLEDGVCGLKVCCIKVEYEGRIYILKEMKKSFNYGRDYMICDLLKDEFGVKSMNMKRIRSNVGLEVVDKKKKSFVKNWKFGDKEVVYCMMEYFENIGDLGKNKEFLDDENVFRESLKIRLFDGLFRSSDNILRNILVNKDGDVLSIDEGDIYGKRKLIFNMNDWFKKGENKEKSKIIVNEILDNWVLENKIDIVEEMLNMFEFSEYVDEMKERFSNYRNIVIKELE